MCPEFEDSLLWKSWLQFLSLSVYLPGRLDDWVLSAFWTLFWLCIFACTLENWTVTIYKCQERMGLLAPSVWITVKYLLPILRLVYEKTVDTRHVIYGCRSSLIWAVCQKSDLCSVKSRKTSIQEVWIMNYFLEVPWSANDGFLLKLLSQVGFERLHSVH